MDIANPAAQVRLPGILQVLQKLPAEIVGITRLTEVLVPVPMLHISGGCRSMEELLRKYHLHHRASQNKMLRTISLEPFQPVIS